MFSYAKTERKSSELENQQAYDTEDIYEQLCLDSSHKCYLCGDSIQANDFEVEHFIPHENGTHIQIKFDWDNLFLSCSYCNGKKSNTYNKMGADKDILKPSVDDIQKHLLHFYDPLDFTGNWVVLSNLGGSEKNENSIELLNKIYNLKGVVSPSFRTKESCRELKNSLKDELIVFKSTLKELVDATTEQQRNSIKQKIQGLLNPSAAFYEFKIGAIKSSQGIKAVIEKHNVEY